MLATSKYWCLHIVYIKASARWTTFLEQHVAVTKTTRYYLSAQKRIHIMLWIMLPIHIVIFVEYFVGVFSTDMLQCTQGKCEPKYFHLDNGTWKSVRLKWMFSERTCIEKILNGYSVLKCTCSSCVNPAPFQNTFHLILLCVRDHRTLDAWCMHDW